MCNNNNKIIIILIGMSFCMVIIIKTRLVHCDFENENTNLWKSIIFEFFFKYSIIYCEIPLWILSNTIKYK